MLEMFPYMVEEEELELKCEAIGWPSRIEVAMEEADGALEEACDVFNKLQVDDEFTMQDRIELITSTITSLAAQSDFSKVILKNNISFGSFGKGFVKHIQWDQK